MMTKLKTLILSGALLTGAVGIAAAQPSSDNPNPDRSAQRAEWQAKRAERKAEMLAKYDLNKDGKLDANERALMREDKAVETFKKMDLDGNGQISLDEFKAARLKMSEHRHARHGFRHFRKGLDGSKR